MSNFVQLEHFESLNSVMVSPGLSRDYPREPLVRNNPTCIGCSPDGYAPENEALKMNRFPGRMWFCLRRIPSSVSSRASVESLFLVSLLAICGASRARAGGQPYVFIVNPGSPIHALTSGDVKDLYLGKSTNVAGSHVSPITYKGGTPIPPPSKSRSWRWSLVL